MSHIDLGEIGPGFSDPALGSQAVYRTVLEALSRPAKVVTVAGPDAVPAGVHKAAALALLALLDQDCTLWLSPGLVASTAAAWLRFHTGCRIVGHPSDAQFAWIAHISELPALSEFDQGSEFEPENSTTCVVQVESLDAMGAWVFHGPGIRGECRLEVGGLDPSFVDQWQRNHAQFPCGIDLLFSAGDQLAGLPRTAQIRS